MQQELEGDELQEWPVEVATADDADAGMALEHEPLSRPLKQEPSTSSTSVKQQPSTSSTSASGMPLKQEPSTDSTSALDMALKQEPLRFPESKVLKQEPPRLPEPKVKRAMAKLSAFYVEKGEDPHPDVVDLSDDATAKVKRYRGRCAAPFSK